MREFLDDDFLLGSETARFLYHSHAAEMPVYDYHNHLSIEDIALDTCFDNLAQAWLATDHYKWRALRANGVGERLCSGDASDWEKFSAWARTVPRLLGNPLYQWTHLELRRYFGIQTLLDEASAEEIYEAASQLLRTPEYSARNLLRRAGVRLVCTTSDPLDDLAPYEQLRREELDFAVHTTWRPDNALPGGDPTVLNDWIDGLGELQGESIEKLDDYVAALEARHAEFHAHGCRLSDHGLERCPEEAGSWADAERAFRAFRCGQAVSEADCSSLQSVLLHELARMDHERGWVQQLHLGALRNTRTRLLLTAGRDSGGDCIGDGSQALALSRFLDGLDREGRLPRTILYNVNPRDTAVLVSMAGSFQDGSVPGKIQYGPAWWFLDQKHGIEEHLQALSSMGLLSLFVGMQTDSRSLLSFPRHEYFRRILCDFLGRQVEAGELPGDAELMGGLVRDVCYRNAEAYFRMAPPSERRRA